MMKKLLMTAAIAVFALTNVNAQELNFGLKAGVNFANVTGDIEDNDMLTGFHVGGIAEYMFDEEMGLQIELLYSAQGTKSSYRDEIMGQVIDIEEKITLDYVNIPVLFKYYVAEGFSLEVGPQVGFLVSAKNKISSEGNSVKEDIKDDLNSLDFGLNAGVGYKLSNGLNFGARYNLGLANIAKNDDGDDFKLNNAVIQLSVGFMF